MKVLKSRTAVYVGVKLSQRILSLVVARVVDS